MSKKSRNQKRRKQPPPRQLPWKWLALGGVALVLVAALLIWQPWSADADDQPAGADSLEAPDLPQTAGAPQLWVEQDTIDAGYQKYDTRIQTTFRLKNVGDQPLQVLESPRVKLVEGC